jgi:hypothetical protein
MIDPNDQTMAPVFTALRVLLVTIGGVLAGEGLANTGAYKWIMIAAGAVGVVGPAAWGLYVAITNAARARQAQAKAVQSGINLVVAGQALTNEGELIQVANPDTTPPKPVTLRTASEIVKNFAPAEAPKAS